VTIGAGILVVSPPIGADLSSNMIRTRFALGCLLALLFTVATGRTVSAQAAKPYEPVPGQAGKDVVWVPTPQPLVDKMLDMAQVTPNDYVIDLGSGDGRNVISAARRGARALGVEFNPDLVALSTRLAAEAGVSDRATFVQGDMFAADISKATVLALFLMPEHLFTLRTKFLELKPGTRIVSNTFDIEGWDPDETATLPGECKAWCSALLWIVPAKVEGSWRLGQGALTLKQEYQMVSGTMASGASTTKVTGGRLRGSQISFAVGDAQYAGRVNGDTIEGTVTTGGRVSNWKAARVK
jgi:Methyltransferase domain